MTHDNP